MTKHELRLYDRYFDAVVTGKKRFEIRKNDRDYKIGDVLIFIRCDDDGFDVVDPRGHPDIFVAAVSYILRHEDFPQGIMDGYVVLGIDKV